jgi:predicted ferric reductase
MDPQMQDSSLNIVSFLSVLFAMSVGMLTAVLVLPTWMPNVAFSMGGESPKLYWYLARGTAFIALTLLWASMMLGIGLSTKMARAWPGTPAAFAVHEYVTLLGLVFSIVHALVLLGDAYINFSLNQVLVPFATRDYRPLWVGIGQVGFYVWAVIALSFYVRKRIGQRTWRLIHYASFLMYMTALVHGLFGGTDSDAPWAQSYYWFSGGSLLFLTFTRIVGTLVDRYFPQRRAAPELE